MLFFHIDGHVLRTHGTLTGMFNNISLDFCSFSFLPPLSLCSSCSIFLLKMKCVLMRCCFPAFPLILCAAFSVLLLLADFQVSTAQTLYCGYSLILNFNVNFSDGQINTCALEEKELGRRGIWKNLNLCFSRFSVAFLELRVPPYFGSLLIWIIFVPERCVLQLKN